MSEQSDATQNVPDPVVETVNKLPASEPARGSQYGPGNRFLTKDKTVHQLLGEAEVTLSRFSADSALWRDKYLSGGTLIGSTVVWFLLEKSGFTFMTLLCNILMFVVVILFVWSNVAALLHRAGPPVPELSLSEDFVLSTASVFREELNKGLAIARDVALGKDFKLFVLVVGFLYVVSTVTSWFNFLTCVWIGIVLMHTVPFVYDKYEDVIDHHAKRAADVAATHYKNVDAAVLSRIPRAPAKQKKMM